MQYIEDLPATVGEVWVECVGSPVAAGRIAAIDVSAVRQAPGVVGVYTVRELPGHNKFGPIFHDEPFLADDVVSYIGQPVVVIAAESRGGAEGGEAGEDRRDRAAGAAVN